MNIEEQIRIIRNNYYTARDFVGTDYVQAIDTVFNLIQKQQEKIEDCKKCILRDEVHDYINELEKKDKIINLMSEQLTTPMHSKEWVIDYYKKKVIQEEN